MAPELVVRADIAIPERHMTITWSLRRNTDKALPASHTIELMFNLPPDFPGGGIANVPGILMKDSEGVRGMPLAGLAVNVTTGFFLIGLNAAEQEMQRNMQLLKEREWFDILARVQQPAPGHSHHRKGAAGRPCVQGSVCRLGAVGTAPDPAIRRWIGDLGSIGVLSEITKGEALA